MGLVILLTREGTLPLGSRVRGRMNDLENDGWMNSLTFKESRSDKPIRKFLRANQDEDLNLFIMELLSYPTV